MVLTRQPCSGEFRVRLFTTRRVEEEAQDVEVDPTPDSREPSNSLGRPEYRPPRVVHVAQTIAGGIASIFEEMAPYQTKAFGKGNVTFVVPEGSQVHLPSVDRSQIVTFAATSRGPAALLLFGREATKAIRRLDPDIVHLHSSFAGALVRTLLRRRSGKPRIVYCSHGWAFGIESAHLKKRLYAAIERRLARRSDLIIVNSQSEHELAVKFGLPEDKLRVVKNGVAWRPPVNRSEGGARLRVAFIGRHDRQKGLDLLLDTIDRFSLPNIEFHVVGEGVLDRTSGRSDNHPNLTFHGWLDRSAIGELLSQLDAVVMPSRWEAFGLVAIEAMRAGVPVIASNRGALPEIVHHGIGGYIFDLDDPSALGLLLASLDRQALEKLRNSARARWETEFSAVRMNELTEKAYESLLPATRPLGRRGHSLSRDVVAGATPVLVPE